MKKYYQTLTKEQKNEIKELYKKDYQNTDLNVRLTRLTIYSTIGYVTSLLFYLDAFYGNSSKVGNIIVATTLLVASTTFLIGRILIKQKVLNKIAIKSKKKGK